MSESADSLAQRPQCGTKLTSVWNRQCPLSAHQPNPCVVFTASRNLTMLIWRPELTLNILSFAAVSVGIYFIIAVALIVSERPKALETSDGLYFTRITASGAFVSPETPEFARKTYTARDGAELSYTHVKTEGSAGLPLIIMIHGSGWFGGQFDRLAWALRDVAEVKAITLRGHGDRPVRRGDVDYIGQFEDDIADLMADDPREAILLGHSSGGGLVVRFAGGENGRKIGGAILLAPFLKHNAPTTRINSGGWAHVLTRRIVGLSMLNSAGIHWLDHMKMIQFNMPKSVLDGPLGDCATTSYSWRLNTSFAPRSNYIADVAELPPFLLVAGAQDEAMEADRYGPLMSTVTDKGNYHVINGAAHLDIVDAPETEALIRDYLDSV
ncbi:alpha/beta fold hydrolase [Acuticoccus sp. MNP-M23]|uniref:alpha/beta hydrolase n=1 Tax=Acuticoccus sp. MNP-M23 TaxID=3072793 RepID=UPI00281565F5|nr:alpha/beta fold hydrolase [Acuticoccus sp. MNP-M23]WMS44520.1 alpha/beta fold hydrolase [Acuticoccus sp. MNP-M23]